MSNRDSVIRQFKFLQERVTSAQQAIDASEYQKLEGYLHEIERQARYTAWRHNGVRSITDTALQHDLKHLVLQIQAAVKKAIGEVHHITRLVALRPRDDAEKQAVTGEIRDHVRDAKGFIAVLVNESFAGVSQLERGSVVGAASEVAPATPKVVTPASDRIVRLSIAIADRFEVGVGTDALEIAQEVARRLEPTAIISWHTIGKIQVKDKDHPHGGYYVKPSDPIRDHLFRIELGKEVVVGTVVGGHSITQMHRVFFHHKTKGQAYRAYRKMLRPCLVDTDGKPVEGHYGIVR